jgi:predicted nuclease of predicted toxin-antitoxin system
MNLRPRFKIDENLPIEVAELLRQANYDAMTVGEQTLQGTMDLRLAQVCLQEHRALITLDTDFANLRTYPPKDYAGLVVLRVRHQDKLQILATVSRLLPYFAKERLSGRLWVVDEQRLRIREE